MSSKALVDLDAISNELLSRGIHFHNDRIKWIRKELNRQSSRIEELEKKNSELLQRVMDKQRELLDIHNDLAEARLKYDELTTKSPTCYR